MAAKDSFTPGPWAYEVGSTRGHIKSVAPELLPSTPTICKLLDCARSVAHQREANSRLIAAAPELLEACKQAQICLADSGEYSVTEKMLDAAIAKAEGKVMP